LINTGILAILKALFAFFFKGKEEKYHKAGTRQLNIPFSQYFNPTNYLFGSIAKGESIRHENLRRGYRVKIDQIL
jgi:hypothetical protein